jgi:hypothetical protein
MIRQLEQNELAMIAGGANDVVEVYPPLLQGYEIIGFSQTLLGWNEDTFAERIGYFILNILSFAPRFMTFSQFMRL